MSIRKKLADGSVQSEAAITAGGHCLAFFLAFTIGDIVRGKDDILGDTIGRFATLGLLSFVIYWIYKHKITRERRAVDDKLGMTLTNKERAELNLWLDHAIRPASDRLQPVLPKFIEHVEEQVPVLAKKRNSRLFRKLKAMRAQIKE